MFKSRTKAFTLIESLFAMGLITLVTIAFLSSLITSISYVRKAYELRTASLILQEQLSLVRELKYSDVQSLSSAFTSDYMTSLKNAAGTAYKSYYGGSDKISKITFQLDWTTFDNKSATRSVATLITDQGIDKR